jgi:flagellar biosynthesis protein FlhB
MKQILFSQLEFDLQLFAGEKTEPATEKRREEARQQGNLPKSQDLASVIILLAAILMFRASGANLFEQFASYLRYAIERLIHTELTMDNSLVLLNQAMLIFLYCLVPFLGIIALASIAVNLYQVGLLFRFEPMTPDLNKLNPISGIQNMFSWKLIAELVKSIFKVLIVSWVPYSTLRDEMPILIKTFQLDPGQSIIITMRIVFVMSMKIILILLVLALADWYFQKWRHEENLKMSKQDIKEEYKQREGDPKVKQKIRERQRQVASRRMMQEVPKATVVVTNPTRIAVALRYDREDNSAPRVVAMGTGLIAARIREIAGENKVPVIENKPLAQALHKMVDVGDEIPSELYQAVAEILAQVYRVKTASAV